MQIKHSQQKKNSQTFFEFFKNKKTFYCLMFILSVCFIFLRIKQYCFPEKAIDNQVISFLKTQFIELENDQIFRDLVSFDRWKANDLLQKKQDKQTNLDFYQKNLKDFKEFFKSNALTKKEKIFLFYFILCNSFPLDFQNLWFVEENSHSSNIASIQNFSCVFSIAELSDLLPIVLGESCFDKKKILSDYAKNHQETMQQVGFDNARIEEFRKRFYDGFMISQKDLMEFQNSNSTSHSKIVNRSTIVNDAYQENQEEKLKTATQEAMKN